MSTFFQHLEMEIDVKLLDGLHSPKFDPMLGDVEIAKRYGRFGHIRNAWPSSMWRVSGFDWLA